MGFTVHNAIVVTADDDRPGGLPDIEAFRASLPERFRQLVIGPIPSTFDAYISYAFLPDGSKTSWGSSIEGDGYRDRFVALFSQHGADRQDDIVAIRYGEDHRDEHGSPVAEYITGEATA